jgi:hypothetical protein
MYRWLFIVVLLLWLVAMTLLIQRDVWPAWTAQDPPRITRAEFAAIGEERHEQLGIFGADNTHIGTAWGDVEVLSTGMTSLTGLMWIDGMPLIPSVYVETTTEFDSNGDLDNFNLSVHGVPMTAIIVRGERRGIYFPCELQVGPLYRQANLDMSASRMIGQSLRPFTVLPKLHVGQSWRMQILDPLSAIQSRKAEFKSVVAQVTGREVITTDETGPVECFVVEIRDQQAKAWVADDGRVLQQEVAVPGIKKIVLRVEKYNERRRQEAREHMRTMPQTRKGTP